MNRLVVSGLALALAGMGSVASTAVRAQMPNPAPPVAAPPAPGVAPSPSTAPPRLSSEDRAALIDARLAGIKAGLRLTPQQEALWPPVEQASRDGLNRIAEAMERAQPAIRGNDPIERLRAQGDLASLRGDVFHRIADAAQPFYASLSADQKRRLPLLLRFGPESGFRRFGAPPMRPGGPAPMPGMTPPPAPAPYAEQRRDRFPPPPAARDRDAYDRGGAPRGRYEGPPRDERSYRDRDWRDRRYDRRDDERRRDGDGRGRRGEDSENL